MKIIKEGDYHKIWQAKRFECNRCGCIFEAKSNEYIIDYQYNTPYYRAHCPFCDNMVYSYEE